MAQEERFGTRDLTYSAWHRRMSLRRFIGIESAQTCAMIDLDARMWVECEDKTYRPLMLIEEARDVGQSFKNGTMIKNEARRGAPCGEDIPAFIVLYTPANEPNPADKKCADIRVFRIRRVWPDPETDWETISPDEWAKRILKLREWSAKRLDRAINKQTSSCVDG